MLYQRRYGGYFLDIREFRRHICRIIMAEFLDDDKEFRTGVAAFACRQYPARASVFLLYL